jgi:DNA-directed RNA polymerase specialized sigma subunit
MTDEAIKNLMEQTVKATVDALKREGLLKDAEKIAYDEATQIIKKYFRDGKEDAAITYAIRGLRFDPYFPIIELCFEEHRTNEQVAEKLGVELSTIVRNKKRLCLAIYDAII